MYLTYEVYTNMGGMLDETAFNNLEFEARSYIDYLTFNRLENEQEIPEKVQQCMFYIISLLSNKLAALGIGGDSIAESNSVIGTITSESNDGVSASYNVVNAKDLLDSSEAEITKAIKRYLQGVTNSLGRKLLYRGLYPNE